MRVFYFLIILLGCSTLFGADFQVDTVNSKVEFKIKHMMFSTVTGTFEKFDGSFSMDEKSVDFFDIDK